MSNIAGELRDLIDEYLGGEMKADRFARLQAWLTEDSRARAYFIRYAQIDFQLFVDMRADRAADRVMDRIRNIDGEGALETESFVGCPASSIPVYDNRPVDDNRPQPSRRRSVLSFSDDVQRRNRISLANRIWTVAAVAAVALISVILLQSHFADRDRQRAKSDNNPIAAQSHGNAQPGRTAQSDRTNYEPHSAAMPQPAFAARFVRAKNCRWEGDTANMKLGSAVPTGKMLHLASGVAEIEFEIGAKVILQSPATLQLVSANSMRLDIGKATVEIKDERARGFKVLTPEVSFVDQGTEFGVEVAPGGGSKIHVFRGAVDVDRKGSEGQSSPLTQRLLANAGARLEAGNEGMTTVQDTGECFIRSMNEADRDCHTVAWWRFEDRPIGVLLPDTGYNTKTIRATADSSYNGNDLYSFSPSTHFSGDVAAAKLPLTGALNGSCFNTAADGNTTSDVYSHSEFSHASPLDIQRITPTQWTIEASVKPARLSAVIQTFVVRDGNFHLDPKSKPQPPRLSFQINSVDRFAISFYDVENRFHIATADYMPVVQDRWYHVAATSDGHTLRLYVDALDGRGYQLQASADLPSSGSTALGKGEDCCEWSVGRGSAKGRVADRFNGLIDEVRVSNVALGPSDFLFATRSWGKPSEEGGTRARAALFTKR
jgi:hypothetical protein